MIDQVARAALAEQERTAFPARLVLGQWALESAWGKASIGNNCFGIKAAGLNGVLVSTSEWFTDAEARAFLAVRGREIIERTSSTRQDGRRLYRVRDWFARFDSIEDAVRAHNEIITNGQRYYGAWSNFYYNHRDWQRLTREIAPVYATADPSEYAHIVISIGNSQQVSDALARAGL